MHVSNVKSWKWLIFDGDDGVDASAVGVSFYSSFVWMLLIFFFMLRNWLSGNCKKFKKSDIYLRTFFTFPSNSFKCTKLVLCSQSIIDTIFSFFCSYSFQGLKFIFVWFKFSWHEFHKSKLIQKLSFHRIAWTKWNKVVNDIFRIIKRNEY